MEKKYSLEPTKERLLDASMGCGAAAAYVSDSLDDIRVWTLVAAVSIGYMISRGLAKCGTKYLGGESN